MTSRSDSSSSSSFGNFNDSLLDFTADPFSSNEENNPEESNTCTASFAPCAGKSFGVMSVGLAGAVLGAGFVFTMAAGAALGTFFGGPVGAIIGAIAGGVIAGAIAGTIIGGYYGNGKGALIGFLTGGVLGGGTGGLAAFLGGFAGPAVIGFLSLNAVKFAGVAAVVTSVGASVLAFFNKDRFTRFMEQACMPEPEVEVPSYTGMDL